MPEPAMSKIWKYTLRSAPGLQRVSVLSGPILDVQVQLNAIVLWICHEPNAVPVDACFFLAETDQQFFVDGKLHFLKTVQLDGGGYVLHIFQRVPHA
jgi:hypothetical protein